MSTLIDLWAELHFLRPYWFIALLLLPVLVLSHRWRKRQEHWQQAIDPHLLVHLLESGNAYKSAAQIIRLFILVLAVVALAGPSWQKIEQPLLEPHATPLVIVLDLSSAITTPDLPPSRLVQARAKLKRLLEQRQGGEAALVVYAHDAFTVTPLTGDSANIILFLDALTPEIMPRDGQNTDRALQWAQNLLQQSGAAQGDILLLTNQADSAARRQAATTHKAGYTVSVLALGTAQGATYSNSRGRPLHSERDSHTLSALATAGGGRYQVLTAKDDDLHALGVLEPQTHLDAESQATHLRAQLWQDQGYWLLLPLLLLVLPAFRRASRRTAGLVLCLSMPWIGELQAEESKNGNLWQRPDQIQHQQLKEGVHAYHEGDYTKAQRLFSDSDNAEAWYNRGNALARQGRYEQAIAAYDRALAQQPDMEDAIANRAIVEAARQQQEQQEQTPQDEQAEGEGEGKNEENASSGENRSQSFDSEQTDGNSSANESTDNASSQASSDDEPSSNNAGEESAQSTDDNGASSSPEQHQEGGDENASSKSTDSTTANSTQHNSNNSAENQPLDAEDSTRQQQADSALQEQIAQALQQEQQTNSNQTGSASSSSTPLDPQQQQQREQQQTLEVWLQRIPDDPGALLRAKFQIEHQRRLREGR